MKPNKIDMGVNLYELKEELASLGFIDPLIADQLRFKMLHSIRSPMIQTDIKRADANIRFVLSFSLDENERTSLEFVYGVAVPKDLHIPRYVTQKVNAGELNKVMSEIDWSVDYGPGFYDHHSVQSNAASDKDRLSYVALGLDALNQDGSEEALRAFDRLMINHWTGTPAEEHSVNLHAANDFYLREQVFSPEVNVNLAANLLTARLNQPEQSLEKTQKPLSTAETIQDTFALRQVREPLLLKDFDNVMFQLVNLGFLQTYLSVPLQQQLLTPERHFTLTDNRRTLDYEVNSILHIDREGPWHRTLQHYDAELNLFNPPDPDFPNVIGRKFLPDVRLDTAAAVLYRDLDVNNEKHLSAANPVSQIDAEGYLAGFPRLLFMNDSLKYLQDSINSDVMNTQNLEFLKKTLLNLGFGDKLNDDLEKKIKKDKQEFSLDASLTFDRKNTDFTLHFKKGDEMYFFNKIDAQQEGTGQAQTFYLKKGNGFTAKEMHNLLEDRSVFKQMYNKEGEQYHAWFKLDRTDLTDNGQPKVKSHDFNAEKLLEGKGIKEMTDPAQKEELMRSLKKGNRQQITVDNDGKDQRYFIAVNPRYKTVDLFDQHLKKIKREEIFPARQSKASSKTQTNAEKNTKQKTEKQADKTVKKKTGKTPKVGA